VRWTGRAGRARGRRQTAARSPSAAPECPGEGFGELASVDLTELPVRGYSTGRLRGDSALIGSLEYRFPIWQIDRGPGVYPIFFQRLVGDVFVDSGTAWNTRAVSLPLITRRKTDPFDDTITSAGAEVSLDFVAGHLVPLRYRVGIAVPFDDDGVKFYTAIGMSF
jgi:outer membrane protein assembly factor BamA